MTAKQIELMLALLETAGTMAIMVPTIGARWRKNRDAVQKMVDEGRDPTPEEHAELTQELSVIRGDLAAALATAQATESG